jgi:hypothetical protein
VGPRHSLAGNRTDRLVADPNFLIFPTLEVTRAIRLTPVARCLPSRGKPGLVNCQDSNARSGSPGAVDVPGLRSMVKLMKLKIDVKPDSKPESLNTK